MDGLRVRGFEVRLSAKTELSAKAKAIIRSALIQLAGEGVRAWVVAATSRTGLPKDHYNVTPRQSPRVEVAVALGVTWLGDAHIKVHNGHYRPVVFMVFPSLFFSLMSIHGDRDE